MNAYEWPSKFSDPEYRRKVGEMLVRHVDEAEMGIKARIDEWKKLKTYLIPLKSHTIEIYERRTRSLSRTHGPC